MRRRRMELMQSCNFSRDLFVVLSTDWATPLRHWKVVLVITKICQQYISVPKLGPLVSQAVSFLSFLTLTSHNLHHSTKIWKKHGRKCFWWNLNSCTLGLWHMLYHLSWHHCHSTLNQWDFFIFNYPYWTYCCVSPYGWNCKDFHTNMHFSHNRYDSLCNYKESNSSPWGTWIQDALLTEPLLQRNNEFARKMQKTVLSW